MKTMKTLKNLKLKELSETQVRIWIIINLLVLVIHIAIMYAVTR